MDKKIIGILVTLIGIAVLFLVTYYVVNKSLAGESIPKVVFNGVFGLVAGIVLLRLGKVMLAYDQFSPDKIAFNLIRTVYQKEELRHRDLKPAQPSKYQETSNMDLADIYKQVDQAVYPEVFEDLLGTIKERVERNEI